MISRAWGYIAAVSATVGVLLWAWLQGRKSGRDATVAEAARVEQQATEAGNAAAANAQRDGATRRLRDGTF